MKCKVARKNVCTMLKKYWNIFIKKVIEVLQQKKYKKNVLKNMYKKGCNKKCRKEYYMCITMKYKCQKLENCRLVGLTLWYCNDGLTWIEIQNDILVNMLKAQYDILVNMLKA